MAKPRAKDCPLIGLMDLFGDYWSWLIIREAFYGVSRFSEFQRNTGIAKNLLSARLASLVEAGVLEKRAIGRQGSRHAYMLTEKGADLETVLVAMIQWSNKHLYGEGKEPVTLLERDSGEPPSALALRSSKGERIRFDALRAAPGPAASSATKRRLAGMEPQDD